MLLRIGAHQEARHVHDLLADADVALADEHARVVDRLGEAELEHESLQAALQELFRAEGKHVIELVLGFILCVESSEITSSVACSSHKRLSTLRARSGQKDLLGSVHRVTACIASRTYQETVGAHTAQDGFAFEDTLRVLLIERQKNTRRVAELVQRELHAPELALVAKAELANDLEFGVETFLLERTSRLLEGLTVCV